jgi:hypothetical protein
VDRNFGPKATEISVSHRSYFGLFGPEISVESSGNDTQIQLTCMTVSFYVSFVFASSQRTESQTTKNISGDIKSHCDFASSSAECPSIYSIHYSPYVEY